jgi:hypothetical protein
MHCRRNSCRQEKRIGQPGNVARPGRGRMTEVYQASRIKRQRATKAEMERRAEFLIDYAEEHGPVTVRQLKPRSPVCPESTRPNPATARFNIKCSIFGARADSIMGTSLTLHDGRGSQRHIAASRPQSRRLQEPIDGRYGTMLTPISSCGARRMHWPVSSIR